MSTILHHVFRLFFIMLFFLLAFFAAYLFVFLMLDFLPLERVVPFLYSSYFCTSCPNCGVCISSGHLINRLISIFVVGGAIAVLVRIGIGNLRMRMIILFCFVGALICLRYMLTVFGL